MTDQTFTTTSDPKDFTVDQVNAYLATADDAERQRVLDLETGPEGKNRSTIQAPDAAPEGTGTETKGETFQEAAAKATESSHEAYAQGYFGTVPSRDGDNPEDLTLAGVTKSDKDA